MQKMQSLNIEVEDIGNNKWIVLIDGETYEIYAPNAETAKSRAIEKHI